MGAGAGVPPAEAPGIAVAVWLLAAQRGRQHAADADLI